MRSRPDGRGAQSVTKGVGKHFESPRNPRDKRKNTIVSVPLVDIKRPRLLARLSELESKSSQQLDNQADGAHLDQILDSDDIETDDDHVPSDGGEPSSHCTVLEDHPDNDHTVDDSQGSRPTRRRIRPDPLARRLYVSWKTLIPTLVVFYQHYTSRTFAKPLQATPASLSLCKRASCTQKRTKLLALFFDHFKTIEVVGCQCSSVGQVLVYFGLFPTAPSQPRMAVSTDLLAFYRALFGRPSNTTNALAAALQTHYTHRGYVINKNGDVIRDPFRRSLGSAVQWFDVLHLEAGGEPGTLGPSPPKEPAAVTEQVEPPSPSPRRAKSMVPPAEIAPPSDAAATPFPSKPATTMPVADPSMNSSMATNSSVSTDSTDRHPAEAKAVPVAAPAVPILSVAPSHPVYGREGHFPSSMCSDRVHQVGGYMHPPFHPHFPPYYGNDGGMRGLMDMRRDPWTGSLYGDDPRRAYGGYYPYGYSPWPSDNQQPLFLRPSPHPVSVPVPQQNVAQAAVLRPSACTCAKWHSGWRTH